MHFLTHLCVQSKSFVVTTQFALWDFVKELEDMDPEEAQGKKFDRRVKNLATLFAGLLQRVAGISILRVRVCMCAAICHLVRSSLLTSLYQAINFTTPTESQITFLRLIFLHLLTLPWDAVTKLFTPLSRSSASAASKTNFGTLREGILFFCYTWLVGQDVAFWKKPEAKEWISNKWGPKQVEERLKTLKKLLER